MPHATPRRPLLILTTSLALLLPAGPILAQTRIQQNAAPQPDGLQTQPSETSPGHLAESEVGEIGQRQTRDQEIGNIKPTERINNRIANRIQSRIRNRIDRDYDPQANAASPFATANTKIQDTRQDRKR